ncbi:type IV toxin-antitoxin system AbiEi family antitoxin domain-containing protein [Kribbella sp. NPDC004875]|uniref:type IV toxin-antitoxin system AbiEi family antitoxin domain-containing protein n=1 Tax=Kribbella sp. NPDC004875 TaxID=3364107 RepID=UPI0036C131E7
MHELLARQEGAFSRGQARAWGISDRSLAVRCRAGRIQRVYRGAYADFSGPVPWETRVWAAWLAYGPDAALAGETALRHHGIAPAWGGVTRGDVARSGGGGVGRGDVVWLEVPHGRRVRGESGVVITRARGFAQRVVASREPPIVRVEVAVLTVASRRATPDGAAALVLDVCRQRRTTPRPAAE